MLKLLFRLIAIALVVAVAWLAFGLLWPTGPSQQKLVQLKAGSSARHIAAELAHNGIIRSEYAFLLWHYMHGRKPLKAGEYAFDHRASLREVYDRIASGDIFFHTVVVPEGYNIFDVAGAIEEAGLGKREDFLKVAETDTALVRDLDPKAPSLEGYLFPDTYHFTRTQSMHDMAAAMVRRFRQNIKEMGINQNVHDVVTMASIVEKETGAPEERPQVASVFYNRLQKNMELKTDPSAIYAALLNNRYSGVIHQSDLHFDSPYNTYRNSGLPPGPISNPGKASLEAALHPAQTDFLYFVADPQRQGHHRFARTDAEHAVNVQAYRRAVQAASR
jgi:peptidoglycan lytic transglycosylase G